MKKYFLLATVFLKLSFAFGQNFRTAEEMKNAIDLYIDLGYHINSCKERCDFDYCSRIFTTWYSQAPKDYYNQREDDITNAWEASKKSSYKSSTCDCSKFEKPNLSLGLKGQKSQAKIKAVGDLTNKTVELISYFANRKNALRNSLSQEDAQALLDIVNSENPTDYAQEIIQIFTDLGYTLREKETKDTPFGSMTTITMNNDPNNVNDFLNIFIHPASKYQDYNSISFSYYRKEKLRQQLSALGSNLEGFKRPEIKGIPPSKQLEIEEKKKEKLQEENKDIEIKRKIAEITPVKSERVIENNITVQSIIENCIIAMGGEEKLKAVENIIEYCENDKSTYKMITAYGKFAFIGDFQGKSSKTIFDGSNGYTEYDGRKSGMNERNISFYKKTQPFYIFELKSRQDLTLGAIETIGNKDYFTIIVPPRIIDGTTYSDKLYFDMESNLYLGQSTLNSYNNTTSYYFQYDYKEIKGIKFPFMKISTSSIGGNSLTKTMTTQIKINQPITDNDFR